MQPGVVSYPVPGVFAAGCGAQFGKSDRVLEKRFEITIWGDPGCHAVGVNRVPGDPR